MKNLIKRRKTRVVSIGGIDIGGDNPIRIQSMTNSATSDVEATVEQIKRLSDVGCEIVRVTVQGIKEALACEKIKNDLVKSGYKIPIVADIHFFPPAALQAAEFVDKVRINPGNYADKRAKFQFVEYDEKSIVKELQKIEEKFVPLVEKCKKLKKVLRIGVNHGSLSDRIMSIYGDTPRGMVESAVEFTEICQKNGFHDIVFSMKSSNPKVMIEAYRLLVKKMDELIWNYPLHLGVTEAGEGYPGIIKSSMGIGSLLLDGLGDTIRVSLTGDPCIEIDPCKRLVEFVSDYQDTIEEIPERKNNGAFVLTELPQGASLVTDENFSNLEKASYIILNPEKNRISFCRKFFSRLQKNKIDTQVILKFSYDCSKEDLLVQAATEFGALLIDGLGDGIWLDGDYPKDLKIEICNNVLQAARLKFFQAEFISCPSCGRTLFDISEVTRQIREKTNHLIGVKIAVMGCIVNGPGEMADADFGFVGSKSGKVDLFKGKERVEKDIDFAKAIDHLIALIKISGKWEDIS